MIDPFAAAPADEAQQAPVAVAESPAPAPEAAPAVVTPEAKPKPATKPKATTAVTNSDTGVTVTFKGGIGFQAPWIVIHADSVEDAYDQVSGDNATLLAQLMERTQVAGKHFASLAPEYVAPAAQTAAVSSAPPAGATGAPGGETRTCPHGQMSFKSGEKNGRVWKAFMCPSPKGTPDQCAAQWLR